MASGAHQLAAEQQWVPWIHLRCGCRSRHQGLWTPSNVLLLFPQPMWIKNCAAHRITSMTHIVEGHDAAMPVVVDAGVLAHFFPHSCTRLSRAPCPWWLLRIAVLRRCM